MLQEIKKPEMFEHDNKYDCNICQKMQDAKKLTMIQKLPKNLIITIGRFQFNRKLLLNEKICNEVEIQKVLKFDEIFEEVKWEESAEYHLYGKIIHTVALAQLPL